MGATTFQLCVSCFEPSFEPERASAVAQVRRKITSNIKLKEQNTFTHTVTQKGKTAQERCDGGEQELMTIDVIRYWV